MEINPRYVAKAKDLLRGSHPAADAQVRQADFFRTDWGDVLAGLPRPVLVLGNPPWVTSAALTRLGSSNLPEKTNFQGHRGLDALTGKGNFDISEWMLLRALEWIEGCEASLAILCKVAVVRRSLRHAWSQGHRIRNAEVRRIDATRNFGASVYTFTPWRVAISGFYKKLDFRVVGSFEGKPIVLDDTCYFVPCGSKDEADCVHDLLRSEPAQGLLSAFSFWDSKRPVTVGLLGRLDLLAVARELGRDDDLSRFLRARCGGGEQLALL